jgi:xanthine/uracil permease
VTGAGIWVDHRVDFSRAINQFLAAVTLNIGAADYTIVIGGFPLNGITLGTFTAIIVYQLFKGAPEQQDFAILGDDAEARAEVRAQ